jgi:hypothetical protein
MAAAAGPAAASWSVQRVDRESVRSVVAGERCCSYGSAACSEAGLLSWVLQLQADACATGLNNSAHEVIGTAKMVHYVFTTVSKLIRRLWTVPRLGVLD